MNYNETPLLTIVCVTYNHEKYIDDAIKGFLSQITNFSFVILVHDDASTDRTAEIVRNYDRQHPDLFRNIYQTENQHSKNLLHYGIIFNQVNTKYIALCEGDDYWTDPLKLQKQVDFLESHEDYNGVFHKVSLLNNTTNESSECILNTDTPDSIEVTDLLKKNIIRTCSILLRTESVSPLFTNNILKKAMPGDWLSFIFAIRNKKMKYLSDNMAVYRIHDGGIWSEAKDIELRYDKELFNGYVFLKQILPYKYFKLVFHRYAYYLGYFATKNLKEKNYMNYILFKLKLYCELLKMNFLKLIIR